jgi:hypothetical protein
MCYRINGVYQGLFWQHEDIDDSFLAARYDNGTGNLYKLSLSVFLKVCSRSLSPACVLCLRFFASL